jgi:hypothetical protein
MRLKGFVPSIHNLDQDFRVLDDARKLKGDAGDTFFFRLLKEGSRPHTPWRTQQAIHTAGTFWPMRSSKLANTAARKAAFVTQDPGKVACTDNGLETWLSLIGDQGPGLHRK